MQINRMTKPLVFNEEEDEIQVCYSNRGEPFSEGVEFQFLRHAHSSQSAVRVLLNPYEVEQLRDKLNEFLDKPPAEKGK